MSVLQFRHGLHHRQRCFTEHLFGTDINVNTEKHSPSATTPTKNVPFQRVSSRSKGIGKLKQKQKTGDRQPYRGVIFILVKDAVKLEPPMQHELTLHVGVHTRIVQHTKLLLQTRHRIPVFSLKLMGQQRSLADKHSTERRRGSRRTDGGGDS